VINRTLANPHSEPAGHLRDRLPWAPFPAGEREVYPSLVSISLMTGPIRNEGRRVVPRQISRATIAHAPTKDGLAVGKAPAAHRVNGRGCAERPIELIDHSHRSSGGSKREAPSRSGDDLAVREDIVVHVRGETNRDERR
jgi:hypothetical protein